MQQRDEIRLGQIETAVEVARHPEILLVVEVADTTVPERAYELFDAGFGTVVAHQRLPALVALRDHALDRAGEVVGPSVVRDREGDRRSCHRGFG